MGLGRAVRNLQYDVTNTETGETEQFMAYTDSMFGYPGWAAGPYQGAMAVPAAWRCATMFADKLGDLPWHAFERGADKVVREVDPTPDYLDQPSPPDTRMTTVSSLGLDLVWHGNTIEVVTSRDAYGAVTATWPVSAARCFVRRARPNDPIYRPGEVVYDIDGTELRSAEVIHTKGPCEPGALRGFGVLETHRAGVIALALEQARQAGNLDLASVPTGTLKSTVPDLTAGEAQDLKAAWQRAQRARTVAVLNSTTDFEPIAWNPTETQLLDARRFSIVELALVFGLDPSWLGAAQTSRVYSNIEQEAINFVRYSAFAGHLARLEGTRTLALQPGQWARANLDAMLRADTLARYQAHQIGITAGFLTPDEARALENRPPLTPEQMAQLEELKPKPAAAPGNSSSGSNANDSSSKAGRSAADLKAYWTKGEGLARWSLSPKPMTTLTALLVDKVGKENALGLAATYYHEVFGVWPSDGPL